MPLLNTGTHDLSSLLVVRNQTIAEFGFDAIVETVRREMEIHNELMLDMVSSLCFITTERDVTFGGTTAGEMIEADEYARVPAQQNEGGGSFGLPLRSFQYAIGWTAEWFKRKTPADLALASLGAQDAHKRRVLRDIKRALFPAANYTFREYTTDDPRVINVKRLLNADGTSIPMGPYGEIFDGATHSHYDAIDYNASTAAQKGAALTGLVEDVMEHGYQTKPMLVIHRADEKRITTAEGFTPYSDPRLVAVPGQAEGEFEPTDLDNRAIGFIGAAEVWVKPWGQPNYVFAYDSGQPDARKPLAFRQEGTTALQGLRVVAQIDAYPLHAEFMKADYGIGAKERSNGAVLYLGGGTYVSPADSVLN